MRLGSEDRRVESLEMSHLEFPPALRGTRDQRARLFRRFRNGFFHQHVCARGKKCVGNLEMRRGGCHHTDGVDLAEQLAVVADRRGVHFAGDLSADLFARIHHGDELAGV